MTELTDAVVGNEQCCGSRSSFPYAMEHPTIANLHLQFARPGKRYGVNYRLLCSRKQEVGGTPKSMTSLASDDLEPPRAVAGLTEYGGQARKGPFSRWRWYSKGCDTLEDTDSPPNEH